MGHWLQIIGGLGLLLTGLVLFSSGLKGLATPEWLQGLLHPFAMLLYSMGFTAVFQSSSLTSLVLLGLVSSNIITLEVGIAGIIGCNVGTCITAFLGSIPLSIEGKRLALSHLAFNVGAAIAAYPMIPWIARLVRFIIR